MSRAGAPLASDATLLFKAYALIQTMNTLYKLRYVKPNIKYNLFNEPHCAPNWIQHCHVFNVCRYNWCQNSHEWLIREWTWADKGEKMDERWSEMRTREVVWGLLRKCRGGWVLVWLIKLRGSKWASEGRTYLLFGEKYYRNEVKGWIFFTFEHGSGFV